MLHWIHTCKTAQVIYVLTCLLAVGIHGTFAVSIESSEFYSTELLNWTVSVRGENYLLDSTRTEDYPHGRGERIHIRGMSGNSYAEISFFDDTDTATQTVDFLLAEVSATSRRFDVVATGNIDNVYYALASFTTYDRDGYVLVLLEADVQGNIDFVQLFYGVDSDFLSDLAESSADVRINDRSFMNEIPFDIETVIESTNSNLAQIRATPTAESVKFERVTSTLIATSPVVIYNHYTNDVLEGVFLHSGSGDANAVVAFVASDSPTATDVMNEIADDQIPGQQPTQKLLQRTREDGSAVGLYRVLSYSGEMLLLIYVAPEQSGLWQIESVAAPPDDFVVECDQFMRGTTIDDVPLLDTVDVAALLNSLTTP